MVKLSEVLGTIIAVVGGIYSKQKRQYMCTEAIKYQFYHQVYFRYDFRHSDSIF